MGRFIAALILWFCATPAFAGQVNPPPPVAAPLCGGGNSVLGYQVPGTTLTCGTALASGSIANGAVGQVGVYGGLNAISPLANIANSVLGITGAGNPTFSATLPSGLTIPGYAVLASPVFTGDPQAPTPATADSDTSIATTAYVKAQGYMSGSGFTAGQVPVTSGPNVLSGSIPFGTTGSVTLVRTNVGGTIDTSLIGDASITGAKLAPGAVTVALGYAPASSAVTLTPAPPLAGGGDLSANRSLSLTGPSNLTTFSANTIPKGAGISAFAASSIGDGGSGVTIGVPAGGPQGPGTLNAAGLFINGVAAGSGGGSANITGLTTGQLGVAGSSTSLASSVPFGATGASTVLQTDPGGKINASVIPNTAVTPGSCTNCNLTIGADGRITVQANGTGGGISTLTGDVAAGPGAGSVAATVTGVQGRLVSPASPSNQDVLTWNQAATRWEPSPSSSAAINQLTGDGTAGPGSGSQALTLATVNSTPGQFAAATFDAKGRATLTANLTGDVTTVGRTASLTNTGVTAGSYNVTGASGAPFCWAVDIKGRITAVMPGLCSGIVRALGTGTAKALGTGTHVALGTH